MSLRSVVFPEPRYPVSTVTGMRSSSEGILSEGGILLRWAGNDKRERERGERLMNSKKKKWCQKKRIEVEVEK